MVSTIPTDQLSAIVSRWLTTGVLQESDTELLKADYAREFGLPGSCTPCYWNNVQTHYRLLLRRLHTVKANPKYIINPDMGASFRPHNAQKAVVNLGMGNEQAEELTDELAVDQQPEPVGGATVLPTPPVDEPKK